MGVHKLKIISNTNMVKFIFIHLFLPIGDGGTFYIFQIIVDGLVVVAREALQRQCIFNVLKNSFV